jgi:localization factor PodJL
LKSRPAAAGLGAAIVLALVALFFLTKDILFGGRDAAPTAGVPDAAAPVAATPEAASTTRPRELYLESYAALKTAETDADERAALKGIEEAAALGHPPAQLQIGEFYKIGQGFDKDPARARQWYERAANGGNVLAMHRLGVMSARGEGGPVDPQASVAWFEKAARLGLVDSQYNLGASYHPTGDDANAVQDKTKSYFWYSVAARNGDAQAGSLAAGIAGGRDGLSAAEKSAVDAEVAAFAPDTPDPIANEISPAS